MLGRHAAVTASKSHLILKAPLLFLQSKFNIIYSYVTLVLS